MWSGGLRSRSARCTIIAQIREIGVNSVRLPWANETLERNPRVADYAVAANPAFKGKHAMEVMDSVIAALAQAHILIVLDNHMSSDADLAVAAKPTTTVSGTTGNILSRAGSRTGGRLHFAIAISPG